MIMFYIYFNDIITFSEIIFAVLLSLIISVTFYVTGLCGLDEFAQ